MNKDVLMNVEIVSNEKGVDKSIIFDALEVALASAAQKRSREHADFRVSIDRKTGDYSTFRRWLVVEDTDEPLEEPDQQICLSAARERQPDIEVGGYVEEPAKSSIDGRIAAQTAKQVILQKVREAERAQVVELYTKRVGEMLSGSVKRIERSGVTLDLGNNVEGFIPREQTIPREQLNLRDRVRAMLQEVRAETRGAQLFLSRTSPALLTELFKIEVPEINEGLIEIKNSARDPGHRAKIAVRAKDQRIDLVGACVGMRGSRVQAVSNELNGERVEVIPWDEEPVRFVSNALAPAEVESVVVDEELQSMDVAVSEDNVAKAKGKEGRNAKLASRLTGWHLNVMSVEQAEEKSETENKDLQNLFQDELEVDEEVALILVQEGFSSLEEIAYVPEGELLKIEEFDETLVAKLRDRASNVLLARALGGDEGEKRPAEDLLNMEGMDEVLANRLASHDVVTMENLAELAMDELMEMSDIDEARAKSLILTARKPWFEAEDAQD